MHGKKRIHARNVDPNLGKVGIDVSKIDRCWRDTFAWDLLFEFYQMRKPDGGGSRRLALLCFLIQPQRPVKSDMTTGKGRLYWLA